VIPTHKLFHGPLQRMLPGKKKKKKKGLIPIPLLTAYIDHLTKASKYQVNGDIISLELLDQLFYARRKPIYQKKKIKNKKWQILFSSN
jgi:hypothetical protein